MSDYDAWVFMAIRDGAKPYAANVSEAARIGIQAGMDQEGGGNGCVSMLPALVANGTVNSSAISAAFERLFRVRLRLGMLDPPTHIDYNRILPNVAASEPHLMVALRAAQESICLYKNDPPPVAVGPPVVAAAALTPALPLCPPATAGGKPWKLLLAGAQGASASALIGNYAESASVGEWGSSILKELQGVLRPPSSRVVYSAGCDSPECNNTIHFGEAIAEAQTADAVVIILGLHYSAAGNATQCDHDKPWITDDACEGEGTDRSRIELPGNQTKLVAALRAAAPHKPLIGLLIHGGALALGSAATDLDAVVDAWYPGMKGAEAIVSVLVGRYNPAGRTAVTWYNSTEQLPQSIGQSDFYGGDGLTYRYFNTSRAGPVLYPFGQ